MSQVADNVPIDLGESLGNDGSTLVCLGTYAADFNAIEYGQRIRHYLPRLKEKGVSRVKFVLNASPEAATALADILDLPREVELLSDPAGTAGRAFGVSSGFRPGDKETSPYVKLFAMLFGLGAPLTLPYVISGYLGNPWGEASWIEEALAVGQRQGRWPGNALVLDGDTVVENKFTRLPVVGTWNRRPLELATLRLQNMVGISIQQWGKLGPDVQTYPEVLTQLGGCVVVGSDGTTTQFEWKDPGICAVASFDDMLKAL